MKTVFNDVDALRAAVESFGLTLEEGGNCRFYQGSPAVDYLVKFPGRYDVGFKRELDGTLSMVCDSELYKPTIYNGQKSEAYAQWGEAFGKLTAEYNVNKITTHYRRKGWTVQRGETRADGSIKLVAQRG